jgi:hypothetical protein
MVPERQTIRVIGDIRVWLLLKTNCYSADFTNCADGTGAEERSE